MRPSPSELTRFAKEKARTLGFELCGVSAPLPRGRVEFYQWWVDQGFAAGMHFLRSQKRRRRHIKAILPEARSVIVCAKRIPGRPAAVRLPGRAYGKLARYAQGEDYHEALLPPLAELALAIDGAAGTRGARAYVDTGPLSERALAAGAGLGWIGKHSLLINKTQGSWLWLGAIVSAAELVPDAPAADHCGRCRRCIDACPTGAILEGLRAVDSRKCLSYWNIEHRGDIPAELHAPMQDWLLGCDICQEACPWNDRSARAGNPEPAPSLLELERVLALDEARFQAEFAGSAVGRPRLEGLQRNARIVLENLRRRPP